MNSDVQAATQAIQGLSPSQSAPAAPVDTSMPAGFTAQGALAPQSTAAPPPTQFSNAINQMYANQIPATQAALSINSQIGRNATDVSNMYNAFNNKRSQDMLSAIQQQNAANPANFKKLPSQDGGYNFQDSTGKPITAWQYAAATGQDMSAVLKGSQNPTDQQYIKDESILNNLSNAWYSGDKSAQDKAAVQAGFKDSTDLHTTLQQQGINTPQDLWKSFMSAYPNVWGQGTGTSVGNQANAGQYGANAGQSNFLNQNPQQPAQAGGGGIGGYLSGLHLGQGGIGGAIEGGLSSLASRL